MSPHCGGSRWRRPPCQSPWGGRAVKLPASGRRQRRLRWGSRYDNENGAGQGAGSEGPAWRGCAAAGTVCWPGRHLARAVLPGALRHAGEAASLRGSLIDPRRRPTEVRSALLEGGNSGWACYRKESTSWTPHPVARGGAPAAHGGSCVRSPGLRDRRTRHRGSGGCDPCGRHES